MSWRSILPHCVIVLLSLALLRELNDNACHLLLRRPFFTFYNMRETNLQFFFTKYHLCSGTHAVISVVLDRPTLVNVPEDLLVNQARTDEAMGACYVHLVLWRQGHEAFGPLELDSDEITSAVHADVVLTRGTIEHLVEIAEANWTKVRVDLAFLTVLGPLVLRDDL